MLLGHRLKNLEPLPPDISFSSYVFPFVEEELELRELGKYLNRYEHEQSKLRATLCHLQVIYVLHTH